MESTAGAVWRVHLSRINTQISFSLTKVMVQGVSLNNPGADACDPDSSTLKRTTREGKLGSHHFSCSVQYFNTLNTTVKRIIKQQGHGACRSIAAFCPLLPLRGCGEICMKKAQRAKTTLPYILLLAFHKMLHNCDSRKPQSHMSRVFQYQDQNNEKFIGLGK